jgi:hypothetical protein
MELSGASFLPDPDDRVTGTVAIEWIEDGAAIVMRQGRPGESPSAAVWIFGRDQADPIYRVQYADDRGVSRCYEMSFVSGEWHMWRTTPEFSQRFEARIGSDGRTIRGARMKSFDGGTTWEHDFNLDYILLSD